MSEFFTEAASRKQQGITADMVREALAYCPTTGRFRWRSGPRAGRHAGTMQEGYVVILLFGQPFRAHRLAWLVAHGEWPLGMVDHINRDRADNRACNLRDVTGLDNARNRTPRARVSA